MSVGVLLPERPAPGLLGRLLDRVEAGRRRSGRRRVRLVAAAAALIVAGPVAVGLQAQGAGAGGGGTVQRYAATDPASGISASVTLREHGRGGGGRPRTGTGPRAADL